MDKQQNYLGPFVMMVFLFFIVGFLTVVNQQFQAPLQGALLSKAKEIENSLATMITFSWFLAYPIFGGVGSRWVNNFGYKSTLIRALIAMIGGLFIFFLSSWYTVNNPDSDVVMGSSTVPVGFFIFLLGSFVVGGAVTILQVVINPYLVACEVKGTQGGQRIQIGGSSNSIGTTIAPYFVTGLVFGGAAMSDIQVRQLMVPFLALMVIILLVAVVLRFVTLPDIQGTRKEAGVTLEKSVWSFSHLTLGVVAIFFYVGVEVAIGANIQLYAREDSMGDAYVNTASLMATLYWGGLLVGRLISSFLSKISPKAQLTLAAVVAAVLTLTAIILRNPWFLVVVGLFHSIMWGAIFTLSVEKLGKYTSAASGVIMIGVVGGAIIPLLQGVLADMMGGQWNTTWLLVVAGELYLLYYALIGSKVKQTA